MTKGKSDIGYYTGWAVAFGLSIAIFIYVIWQGNAETLCKGDETEHCFREWLSASSGWAAAAVALPSIFLLSRQISAAEKIYRRGLLTALLPQYNLARRVSELAQMIINETQQIEMRWQNFDDFKAQGLVIGDQFRKDLRRLHDLLQLDEFRRFENEVLINRTKSISGITDVIATAIEQTRLPDDQQIEPVFALAGLCVCITTGELRIFAKACIQSGDKVADDFGNLTNDVG